MAKDGHEFGNHGYLHQDWTELTDSEVIADLSTPSGSWRNHRQ